MTVYTLQAPMPPLRLVAGMKLRLEAINPTTGVAVAGVNASHWTIYGSDTEDLEGGPIADTGPYMLVPGLAPVESTPLPIRGGL